MEGHFLSGITFYLKIGVGEATSATGKSYVTALFSPQGNKQKEIAQNVLPVTGADKMTNIYNII